MKKIIFASSLCALLLASTGCDNYDDRYAPEYADVLRIKDAESVADWERTAVIYSLQESAPVPLVIQKGGWNPDLADMATLRVMTDAEFAEFAEHMGVARYKQVPTSCFNIGGTQGTTSVDIDFPGRKVYEIVNLNIYPSAYLDYRSQQEADAECAIGLILDSKSGNLDNDAYRVLILPEYRKATIGFAEPGFAFAELNANDEVGVDISLPFDNQWDITCNVEVDQTVLDAYNADHGTSYTLMKPATYSGLQESYNLPAGTNSTKVNIKLNIDAYQFGEVLPLRITSCNLNGLEITESTATVLLAVDPERFRIPITAAMLSSNAVEPSEGSLANLLDGNVDTFFHTAWSVAVNDPHYVQVKLPNKYKEFMFSYTNRSSNGNAALAWFDLFYGTDENNLALYKMFSWDGDGLPGGAAGVYVSPSITLPEAANIFRFQIHGTNWSGGNFFVWSEFSMYAK